MNGSLDVGLVHQTNMGRCKSDGLSTGTLNRVPVHSKALGNAMNQAVAN